MLGLLKFLAAVHAHAHVAARHYDSVAVCTQANCALFVGFVFLALYRSLLVAFFALQPIDALDFEWQTIDNYTLLHISDAGGPLLLVEQEDVVTNESVILAVLVVVDGHNQRVVVGVVLRQILAFQLL